MENKTYTVQEFVEKYNATKEIERSKLLKEIGVKSYVPYAQKVVHSETVLNATAKRINGVLQEDSSRRYLVFVTSIIKLYTNLITDPKSPHTDYDLLKESGVLNAIIEKIGLDFEEFTNVFNMTWDDMMCNENNWRTFIAAQFSDVAKAVVETIGEEEFSKQVSKFKNPFIR